MVANSGRECIDLDVVHMILGSELAHAYFG